MRSTRIITALSAAAMAIAVAAPGLAGPGFDNKYESTSLTDQCEDGQGNVIGTVTYDGPEYLWPPNHKMQDITVTAADVDAADADNDTVTLAFEIVHEEYTEDGEEMNGAGNTAVDSTGGDASTAEDATSVDGQIRSERSGRGDGRTYTLNYQADFVDGAQDADGYGEAACVGSFEVQVPHDMRGGAGWKHDCDGDGDGDRGNGKNDRNGGEGCTA